MDCGAGVGAIGSACADGLPTGPWRVHATFSIHSAVFVHAAAGHTTVRAAGSFTNSGAGSRAHTRSTAGSGGACNPDALLFAMRLAIAGGR